MSLSLTDYYCASIAPGSATLLQMRRGWHPAIVQKNRAGSTPKSAGSPWQEELGLLEGLLNDARRGLPLNVVISNHYMRYRLIPAPPLAMPKEGVQELLQHCFREIYGDVVHEWEVRANPLPNSGDTVVCAVDKALVEGLKVIAGKNGLKLTSMQPYFMAGFNVARRMIGSEASCFVQVEPGRIMVSSMNNKNWLGLRAVAATAQWKEEISAHVEREILLAGWDSANSTVFLYAPEAAQSVTLAEGRRWKLNRLFPQQVEGYSPQHDACYAMALSGVQ